MFVSITKSLVIGISVCGLGVLWIYEFINDGYIMLKEGTIIYANQAIICTSSATIFGLLIIIAELRSQKKMQKQ